MLMDVDYCVSSATEKNNLTMSESFIFKFTDVFKAMFPRVPVNNSLQCWRSSVYLFSWYHCFELRPLCLVF